MTKEQQQDKNSREEIRFVAFEEAAKAVEHEAEGWEKQNDIVIGNALRAAALSVRFLKSVLPECGRSRAEELLRIRNEQLDKEISDIKRETSRHLAAAVSATRTSEGPISVYVENVRDGVEAAREFLKLVDGSTAFSGKLPMVVENGLCIAVTGTGSLGVENANRIAAALNTVPSTSGHIKDYKALYEKAIEQLRRSTPLLPKWPDILIKNNWSLINAAGAAPTVDGGETGFIATGSATHERKDGQ